MPRRSSVIDNVFFFIIGFHKGWVNISLHLVSCAVLGFGIYYRSVPLILIGAFVIDSFGHVHNYYMNNKDPRYGFRMLPYQLIIGLPPFFVLLWLFDFI